MTGPVDTEDYGLMEKTLEFWDSINDNSNNSYTYHNKKWLFLDKAYCPIHEGLSEKHKTTYRLLTLEALELGFDKLSLSYIKDAWDIINHGGFLEHVNQYGNILLHQASKIDGIQ